MGLITRVLGALFGSGRNVVVETLGAVRPNAEAADARGVQLQAATLKQMSAEFGSANGPWGRFVDGLNRLPRPLMAFGVIALFASAMFDPLWFGERMQGLALVPEHLWDILWAIVGLYFGARELQKHRSASMQKEAARMLVQAPLVAENIETLRALRHDSPGVADTGADAALTMAAHEGGENAALADWRAGA